MASARASKNQIKEIRALRLKKRRDETRTYLAEGISIVLRAVELGAPIRSIIYSPDLLRSEPAYRVIEAVRGRIPCYEADAEAFASLSGRDNPVGIAAVIAYADPAPEDLPVEPGSVFVALDGIKSPGNLGTILRTADGLGCAGVMLIGETTDQYHPECVKASMGTLFSVPVAKFESNERFAVWCRERRLALVTTSCRARDDITRIDAYPRPAVLLLGAEATGLAPEALAAGHLQVRIPMRGAASSLNVAVAAGILLYDIMSKPVRERRDE